jgi:L-rhamnose mutarotase
MQNGCCYSGGGSLFVYLEHVGVDWQADVAGLAADPEFKKTRKEFQSLFGPGRESAHRSFWMSEVFHLD